MKQTAMQQLKSRLYLLFSSSHTSEEYAIALDKVIEEINDTLLKEEKWQIINAWCHGAMSVEDETAESFYNEKYKK